MSIKKEGHVDFTTIREGFYEYELEDGLHLRVKPTVIDVITKIVSNENAGSGSGIRSGLTLIFEVFSKVISSLDDLSRQYTYEENKSIRFRSLQTVVNLYETQSAIILFDYQLQRLFATKQRDNEGLPVFRQEGNTEVRVVQKPSMVNLTGGEQNLSMETEERELTERDLSERDRSIFRNIFWARVCQRYRNLRRNTDTTEFVFDVDDVTRPLQEGGLGIGGFEQPAVRIMLREIQDQDGLVELLTTTPDQRRFRLTPNGIQYCRRLPVTYG
jgi:hypothetical protein